MTPLNSIPSLGGFFLSAFIALGCVEVATPESVLMVLAFSLVPMLVVDLDRTWECSPATLQTPILHLAKQIGAS